MENPPTRFERIFESCSPAPLLFTDSGLPLFLEGLYKGRAAFLIAGGLSLKNLNLDLLKRPGCVTMGVNNSVRTFRPQLWTCVDNPQNFLKSIWLDPKVIKFVPTEHSLYKIFDNESWNSMDLLVSDCPSMAYFIRNDTFDPNMFLWDKTVNWGDPPEKGGAHSVLLPALRILYYLGIRHVFLLGVDFHMNENQPYHFPQRRTTKMVEWNNRTYSILKERLKLLCPIFESAGLSVYNCNPVSALEVFPFYPFDDAIGFATHELPDDIENERSEGLYENADIRRLGSTKDLAQLSIPGAPQLITNLSLAIDRDDTKSFGIVTLCNNADGRLLKWWVSRLRDYCDAPITFVDAGLDPEQRKWCALHGHVEDIPGLITNLFNKEVLKPFAIAQAPYDKVIFIDLRCEVQSSLAELFEIISRFLLLSPTPHREVPEYAGPIWFETSIVGISNKHPILSLWCERITEFPEVAPDKIWNDLLCDTRAQVIPLPPSYRNQVNGELKVKDWSRDEQSLRVSLQEDS